MAVEADTERAVFLATSDFAQAAIYTPSGGSGASINGVFDNGDGLVDLGGRVGVTASDPQFHCRSSDVSFAGEGDSLVTGSTNYTIRDVIDDGTSMTTLMLEAD